MVCVPVGSEHAHARIVVLTDHACAYCREYQRTLDSLVRSQPDEMQIQYISMPLSRVGVAFPAARASQCAAESGLYAEFSALLFSAQDTLARVDWDAAARLSGVTDLAAFASCRDSKETRVVIEERVRLAWRAGIRATPTTIIGTHALVGTRSASELLAAIQRYRT